MSINGHKTNIHKVKERKEKKNIRTSLHPSKSINTPFNKNVPILTLSLSTRLLSTQNYSRFLSRMTKGKSLRGRHLIITGRASILIIITIITILICRSLRRRTRTSGETTEVSLSSCYTIDTGVHLIQLISESVKASIHAMKLRHDGL